MKKKTLIGTWPLGSVNVELIADPNSTGGDFKFVSAGGLPKITIGFQYQHWTRVLNVLLHETMEFLLSMQNTRYELDSGAVDHASYLFSFDHCKLSAVCNEQAIFLANAMPALSGAFSKHLKSKKK